MNDCQLKTKITKNVYKHKKGIYETNPFKDLGKRGGSKQNRKLLYASDYVQNMFLRRQLKNIVFIDIRNTLNY